MKTLIKKLELEYQKWCDIEDNAESDIAAYHARGACRAIKDCIDIVRVHELEVCNLQPSEVQDVI